MLFNHLTINIHSHKVIAYIYFNTESKGTISNRILDRDSQAYRYFIGFSFNKLYYIYSTNVVLVKPFWENGNRWIVWNVTTVVNKMEFCLHRRITQSTILIRGQIFILNNEILVISVTKVVSGSQEEWILLKNILNKHSSLENQHKTSQVSYFLCVYVII